MSYALYRADGNYAVIKAADSGVYEVVIPNVGYDRKFAFGVVNLLNGQESGVEINQNIVPINSAIVKED